MGERDRVGTIPVWKLNGKPSASGDMARVAQLERVLEKTPIERVRTAIALGTLLKETKK